MLVKIVLKFQYLKVILIQIYCLLSGFEVKYIYNIIHTTIYGIKYISRNKQEVWYFCSSVTQKLFND